VTRTLYNIKKVRSNFRVSYLYFYLFCARYVRIRSHYPWHDRISLVWWEHLYWSRYGIFSAVLLNSQLQTFSEACRIVRVADYILTPVQKDVPIYVVKAHGGVEFRLHSFITSAIGGWSHLLLMLCVLHLWMEC